MANKRQRLARKRFRESSQALNSNLSQSENTHHKAERDNTISPSPPTKKNKPSNSRKKPAKAKKHPLRIHGRKPGEGCFICKATDHISKNCPKLCEKEKKKICLYCREIGHTLKRCPSKEPEQVLKFCYNCGEVGHRLSKCSEPIVNGGTTFAKCFLCKQDGHLSKNCPSNTHGIYPKGGACKICGGVTHLAKDCPEKHAVPAKDGLQRVKLKISKEASSASQLGPSGKHIVFRSGDDLDDDFVQDDKLDQSTGTINQAGDLADLKPLAGKRVKDRMESQKLLKIYSKPIEKNHKKATQKVIKFA